MFNKLVDKRFDEKTVLDQKVNRDDLIYRCKGKRLDKKFDKYDNALDLIDKIKNGEIRLADVKNDQKIFKSHLGEIKKETIKQNQKSKETQYTILKCSTKQWKKLLIFLMIIFQWCLKQKIKQLNEKDLKY